MAETVFDRDKRIRNAALTMGQTFYLCTLNQFVGKNADAWPSQTTIAAAMNATKRGVQKWQSELEAAGVIRVDVGKGRASTNRYRLNLEALQQKPDTNDEQSSPFKALADEQMTNTVRPNDEHSSPEMTNTVRTERTVERTRKEQAIFFPSELNNEEFKTAWSQWVEFRFEIKKRLTASTVSKQLTKLATWGSLKAVQAIENSISNGWQGLFDPEQRSGKASGNAEALKAWQKILRAAESNHGNAAGFESEIGPELTGIVKSLRLTRQKIDQASNYDKREQEREFLQAFSRQGAAA